MDTLTQSQEIAQQVATKISDAINTPPNMEITWEHIMLAIAGALLYNLLMIDNLRKTKTKFSIFIWLRLNIIPLIITGISIYAMFLLREDLKDTMGFDMSNRLGCLLAGFTAHTLISKLKNIASKGQITKNNNDNGNTDSNQPEPNV